mmetsp:Transcript_102715/g.314216  ORF Transcript_102715/g.314216 Transcript_102715/m.314216 type:complete len:227 (-) Transcript_102715:1440-2120(-)
MLLSFGGPVSLGMQARQADEGRAVFRRTAKLVHVDRACADGHGDVLGLRGLPVRVVVPSWQAAPLGLRRPGVGHSRHPARVRLVFRICMQVLEAQLVHNPAKMQVSVPIGADLPLGRPPWGRGGLPGRPWVCGRPRRPAAGGASAGADGGGGGRRRRRGGILAAPAGWFELRVGFAEQQQGVHDARDGRRHRSRHPHRHGATLRHLVLRLYQQVLHQQDCHWPAAV